MKKLRILIILAFFFSSGILFALENVGTSVGLAVGIELLRQASSGQGVDLQKAIKTVTTAEFVGGAVGSTVGAAAGAGVAPFLSRIPIAGGILAALAPVTGGVLGYAAGSTFAGEATNGASMTAALKDAFQKIDWVSVAGQSVGSTIGMFMGSFLGPYGIVAGGLAGGYLGDLAAKFIASRFASKPEVETKTRMQQAVDPSLIMMGDNMTASLSSLLSDSDPYEPTPMKIKIKVKSGDGPFGD